MTERINPHKDHVRTWALAAVFFSYFVAYFTMATMNVSLPRIAAALNGMSFYSWAIAVPALASTLAMLVFGKLSDTYGRKIILLLATAFILLGALLSALASSFIMLVASLSLLMLGQGAISPLCFTVLADIFPPQDRGKWFGLLNISSGVAALIGPSLGGWVVDHSHWQMIFWLDVPLILISAALLVAGLRGSEKRPAGRTDSLGIGLLALACTSLVLALSWAGTTFAWNSIQTIGLLSLGVLMTVVFLWVESKAAAPILDLRVLTNRVFLTTSLAALFSVFGITAMISYFPLFLQGVQGMSATLSGSVITPFSVLMSFMGVPAGFILARTRKYKWMFITGYAIMVAAMFGLVSLGQATGIGWSIAISVAVGIGIGTIPTINALVVQAAVPREMLGAATGGLYFFVTLGKAIAPALLGSAMNTSYTRVFNASLPTSLQSSLDKAGMVSLGDPKVLLSPTTITDLQTALDKLGDQAAALFDQVLQSIRHSLDSALNTVFLIGAVLMLISFIIIITVPEIPLEEVKKQEENPSAPNG